MKFRSFSCAFITILTLGCGLPPEESEAADELESANLEPAAELSAQDAPAALFQFDDTTTLQGCTVWNNKGDSVKVRALPNANPGTTVVGYLYPGWGVASVCKSQPGGSYSCFGNSGNEWVRVLRTDGSTWGYVGWRCVTGP